MIVDAGLSGVGGSETALLTALLREPAATPQLNASITMTAATIVRGGQDSRLQEVFTLVADGARPAWQRAALMSGAEAALLGAAMPGGGGGGAWSRPRRAAGWRNGAGRTRWSRKLAGISARRRRGACRVDSRDSGDLGGGAVEGTGARRAGR